MDVKHIAELARLVLTKKEERELSEHFKKMLAYVKILDELKLEEVPPFFKTLRIESRMREDKVGDTLIPTSVLDYAPDRFMNYFRAPSPLKRRKKK